MFEKILIANRGEIAVRIIRAAREMGIKTVAIYSEVDRNALHVKLADEAVCIGSASSKDSYLNMSTIINTTVLKRAGAIHPGFGFLSENSKFAKMCRDCKIKFIGPHEEIIHKMGNKALARKTMQEANIPVIPGSDEVLYDVGRAKIVAEKIGFPIMVKASSGGGGRGMRVVYSAAEFDSAFLSAKEESLNAFGDDSMYIEKFIENPKHIEFQILADEHGNVIHLGERDCSMQRKNQKVIEEAPSSILTPKQRTEIGKIAVKIAKTVGYQNAGTIEFLLDKNGDYYFMEMNTRLQVEHPITEMVTGIDIVKKQLEIASGEKLTIKQKDLTFAGCAIECRINAEEPEKGFRPSPGKIKNLLLPGGLGIRVDSAMYDGYKIPSNYDSMVAKIIAYDKTREEAICKMKRALYELQVEGIKTNIDFLLSLLSSSAFINGNYDTAYIKNNYNF